MAQGRNPKPTAQKVLEGNPGKRELNTKEPKPEKKAPACPKWLDDEAKKEWKRLSIKVQFFERKLQEDHIKLSK